LPAYSPELNPVERLWLYLKERFLSHRIFDDQHAIVVSVKGTPSFGAPGQSRRFRAIL
jgi:hypothetical protein